MLTVGPHFNLLASAKGWGGSDLSQATQAVHKMSLWLAKSQLVPASQLDVFEFRREQMASLLAKLSLNSDRLRLLNLIDCLGEHKITLEWQEMWTVVNWSVLDPLLSTGSLQGLVVCYAVASGQTFLADFLADKCAWPTTDVLDIAAFIPDITAGAQFGQWLWYKLFGWYGNDNKNVLVARQMICNGMRPPAMCEWTACKVPLELIDDFVGALARSALVPDQYSCALEWVGQQRGALDAIDSLTTLWDRTSNQLADWLNGSQGLGNLVATFLMGPRFDCGTLAAVLCTVRSEVDVERARTLAQRNARRVAFSADLVLPHMFGLAKLGCIDWKVVVAASFFGKKRVAAFLQAYDIQCCTMWVPYLVSNEASKESVFQDCVTKFKQYVLRDDSRVDFAVVCDEPYTPALLENDWIEYDSTGGRWSNKCGALDPVCEYQNSKMRACC